MSENRLVSIVAPVLNEVELIEEFYRRTTHVAESLVGFSHELILVDDGSSDGSFHTMQALAASDARVRLLKLSRNFGHQVAITAGIDHARGDFVVVMDCDLQDPPEVIPSMLAKCDEGYDVVYGVREKREGETALKIWTSSVFYRLLSRMTKIDIPVDVGDFRLLSRRAAEYLSSMREQDRFVRGLVSWIGFKQTGVHYRREARHAGETKYPYRKMIKFAFDGLTAFSTIPLQLAMWLGYGASVLAFLYLCSVFVQKWLGNTVQGWATIMVAMLFLGGVQLICLGILGEYIGRIFTEIKRRPMYLVEELITGDQSHESPVSAALASRTDRGTLRDRASTPRPVMQDNLP